jgi:hypothetical protein
VTNETLSDSAPSTIIFEEVSPYGTVMAIVEDDGDAVYLHIVGPEGSDIETRSLWLRNRRPAPPALYEGWKEGPRGPPLPFDACAHPAGLPAIAAEKLSAVWFADGDAVAIREGNVVLGVIPPWAGGEDACPGYARDCRSATPVAWPLGKPQGNPVLARVDAAIAFWDDWNTGSPWPAYQEALIGSWDAGLGKHARYFAIDGGKWPPRFLSEHPFGDHVVYATGGMSVRPQPRVERWYAHPAEVLHVELALALPRSLAEAPPMGALNHLSQLCVMPWHMDAWLATGHTVPAKGIPTGPSGTTFPAFLVHAAPPGVPTFTMPRYRTEAVNILWLIPITEAERTFALETGSETLIEKLFAAGVTGLHRDRTSVV